MKNFIIFIFGTIITFFIGVIFGAAGILYSIEEQDLFDRYKYVNKKHKTYIVTPEEK